MSETRMDRPVGDGKKRPRSGIRPAAMKGMGGAMVSLAATVGTLIGARAVAVFDTSGLKGLLRLPSLPSDGLGLPWSDDVLFPAAIQDAALDRVAALLVALFLCAGAVALIDALILLFEAGASRKREIAIRASVGAPPAALLSLLLRGVRTLVAGGVVLGVLLGIAAGGVARATWPGFTEAWGTSGLLVSLPLTAVGALVACTVAYVAVGFGISRGPALAPALLEGGAVTSGRGESARRRLVSALQMGLAGAVVIGALALAGSGVTRPGVSPTDESTVALSFELDEAPSGEDWTAVLRRVEAVPGIEAGSLATPGALVGLGVRDRLLTHCGNCVRGLMVLPFWSVLSDHHAVGPGFFSSSGLELVEGRDFTHRDGPDAPKVAIVNRTLANSSFEKGEPIGRRIRLGSGLDGEWYTVVGIVEDRLHGVVGSEEVLRGAVYVSALQTAPRAGNLILQGSADGIEAARALLARSGLTPGPARSVAGLRAEAARPLAWVSSMSVLLGGLALLLALHGARETTLLVTRRRTREVALRRALGASDRRVVMEVLGGAARGASLGVVFAVLGGSFLVAILRKAAGGVPAPGATVYVTIALVLVSTAALASLRAAREALAVPPAAATD